MLVPPGRLDAARHTVCTGDVVKHLRGGVLEFNQRFLKF